jgi:hypothetical protein
MLFCNRRPSRWELAAVVSIVVASCRGETSPHPLTALAASNNAAPHSSVVAARTKGSFGSGAVAEYRTPEMTQVDLGAISTRSLLGLS